MKIFYFISALILSMNVNATSLHPCMPVIEALPTSISCRQNQEIYSIIVRTIMSPAIPQCTGDQRIEYKTAYVEIKRNGLLAAKLEILNSEFSYNTGPTGSASFQSQILGLDLSNCISPINGGGFSGSN